MNLSHESLEHLSNELPETDPFNSTGELPYDIEIEDDESDETEKAEIIVSANSVSTNSTTDNIAKIAFRKPGKGGSSWFPCQCCGEVRKFGNCGRGR